jgi:bifunctional DNA-binding transcriptional regulator/antitoxin component of YhaV-PrlF toxin-antitoxin module
VVIPDEIRRRLGLRPGARFVVVGRGDVVVLKEISAPSLDEFDELIREARQRVKEVGLKQRDVAETVTKVRRSR